MRKVFWLGPPEDGEELDVVALAFKTPRQVEEAYAQLRNVAEEMSANGQVGTLVLRGRFAK